MPKDTGPTPPPLPESAEAVEDDRFERTVALLLEIAGPNGREEVVEALRRYLAERETGQR